MAKLKEAYYFSHDSNARHDPKIMKLRSVYGNEGYAEYFMIVEMLRDQQNFKHGLDEFSVDAIAFDLRKDKEYTKKFILDCINFKLFFSDENNFWSESLFNRMKIKVEKSKKMRVNAEKRWGNKGIQKQSKSNAIALQKQSKGNALKERKGKEKKYNNYDLPDKLNGIISSELWKEWEDYRTEIKKPLTDVSVKKQVEFLLKQSDPAECINSAIRNHWQGLFEVKHNEQKKADLPKPPVLSYDEMFGMPGGTT